MTKGQQVIRQFTRAARDTTGNLPSLPGIFPDYPAPVVFNAPDGEREWANLIQHSVGADLSLNRLTPKLPAIWAHSGQWG
jgi:hypothetical protein